jgi:hypothetical protein
MIDSPRLLADLKKLLPRLEDNLRARSEEDAATGEHLKAEWKKARDAGRTALAYEAWREEPITQAAVAWILSCVFLRFLEDNGLLDERTRPARLLQGVTPDLQRLAEDRYTHHIRTFPSHSDRDVLLALFREAGALPGAAHLFDPRHNFAFALGLSADGARLLREFWQRRDETTGDLLHAFTDPQLATRFLGDLYQDLSEAARQRYALLQTPEFVEEFLLDRTLTPALEEVGFEKVRLIDPACGSGHFLLGAFHRLVALWQTNAPGLPAAKAAQGALDSVFGVDLNPYAAAIARFRLLVAALKASGLARLAEAPDFTVNVAVGDSLLHGPKPSTRREDRQLFLVGEDPLGHLYETEDADALRKILGQRYHVVVANPPYITVKDAGLNQLYRERFSTCKGKYSLVCPFTERLVDLCEQPGPDGRGTAGRLGAIVSNAFMKREFGSKLVEEFLPKWDLTHVLDTSGAYIPGHGTPTVILLMRGRKPLGETVRAVMGIRGEPTPPEDPAKGLVWTEIVGLVDRVGARGSFVSVSDVDRERFAKHPWSLGGGGAADLKDRLDTHCAGRLGAEAESIGFASFTGTDEVFTIGRDELLRNGCPQAFVRPFVFGEITRDWAIRPGNAALAPYDIELNPVPYDISQPWARFLWCFRTPIRGVLSFGGKTRGESDSPWWGWYRWIPEKYRRPLSITFGEVATHNHFSLERGQGVFNQTAPVIKLRAEATEDLHLSLLGLLNSSTGDFWAKQAFFPKGGSGIGRGVQDEEWESRIQRDGTKLHAFPLPDSFEGSADVASRLDSLAQQHEASLPPALLSPSQPAPTRTSLDAARATAASLRRRQIALQEELDWQVYRLYGLLDDDLTYSAHGGLGAVPEVALGERAFEIVLARAMAAGEVETKWFERHGSTPVTEVPARWPAAYRDLVERRIRLIASNPNIALIEKPEYKRRWALEPWEEMEKRALRSWLLDRLEEPRCWPVDAQGAPSLQSAVQLCDRVRHDEEFLRVAELYAGRPDADLEKLVADLALEEAVPYLAAFRYTDDGLRKRAVWERTWDLQRREDAGETLDIPVPPKYAREDFRKGSYWSLRGKLDVPKERFVHLPAAERAADPSPVLGWAGWDHLQRARALAAYYLRMKTDEGWPPERLVPLLAGLAELLPWLKQWHDDLDAATGERLGTWFAAFVADEARANSTTVDSLIGFRASALVGGKRKRFKIP